MSATPLARTAALLCGGTAGIGLAAARQLIAEGVPQVMIVGRTASNGKRALDELREHLPAKGSSPEPELHFAQHDVTTAEGAQGAVADAITAFGRVDLLVNTAGAHVIPELFHRQPIEKITGGFEGLLRGAMLPSRAVLPHMIEQKSGVILNVASDAGKVATTGESVIGAGMAGVGHNALWLESLTT